MKKSPRCRQADDFLGRVCWLHIQPDITKDIFFRNTLGNELDCVEGGATPGLIQNNYDIRRQVSNHKKLEVAQFLAADSSSSSSNVVCLFVCLFGSQVEKSLLTAC